MLCSLRQRHISRGDDGSGLGPAAWISFQFGQLRARRSWSMFHGLVPVGLKLNQLIRERCERNLVRGSVISSTGSRISSIRRAGWSFWSLKTLV